MVRVFLPSIFFAASGAEWYDGIEGLQVLSPGDSFDWETFYSKMRSAQWSEERHAILLKAGEYLDADIGVGYYTSIIGVGATRNDVKVNSVYARDLYDDGSGGGATQNFWRSAEGFTAVGTSNMWATSQACPIRRAVYEGSLRLSDTGPTSWSSGGFVGDTHVKGGVECGTQQQFFFRNSVFDQGVQAGGLINGVFIGTEGEGSQNPSHVSQLTNIERMAEKPFLVESDGLWNIAVPNYRSSAKGVSDDTDLREMIPIDEVHVARDGDSADSINLAIQGKRALLLTPGFYALDGPIRVVDPDFVVLGIGYPTLVPTVGSALVVEASATDARVAAILIDAGVPASNSEAPALLQWQGAGGVLSDIFARVGAFKYQRGSKESCMPTRADVLLQVDGDNVVVDNTWLWHADHDDCYTASDDCQSGYGMLVQGADVAVYDLKVEHVFKDHVFWKGERGQMFFLQEELPYHYLSFGSDGNVGYRVADNVVDHTAYALGVYIVGVCGDMQNVTAIRVPPTTTMNNMVAWDNGKDVSAFAALLCTGDTCSTGSCAGSFCRLQELPGPAPAEGELVLISSQSSLKCLELVNGVEVDGTQVDVTTCNPDSTSQQWVYTDGQIMHHTQDNQALCLDDPVHHSRKGDKLKVSDCNGSPTQQWHYDHFIGSIQFQAGTMCMDLTDGALTDGTLVQLWNCDSGSSSVANQRWTMRAANQNSNEVVV